MFRVKRHNVLLPLTPLFPIIRHTRYIGAPLCGFEI